MSATLQIVRKHTIPRCTETTTLHTHTRACVRARARTHTYTHTHAHPHPRYLVFLLPQRRAEDVHFRLEQRQPLLRRRSHVVALPQRGLRRVQLRIPHLELRPCAQALLARAAGRLLQRRQLGSELTGLHRVDHSLARELPLGLLRLLQPERGHLGLARLRLQLRGEVLLRALGRLEAVQRIG